jgi:transposase-like protein
MKTKKCTRCKQEKPSTNEYYSKCSKCKDGLKSCCKECSNKLRDEWRQNNSEKIKEQKRLYREKNRDKIRHQNQQYRAKNPEKRRVEKAARRNRLQNSPTINYTEQDIKIIYDLQNGYCLYCGCLLLDEYHADHFIPLSKGGTNGRENLVCACPKCNLSKHALMPNEWQGWNGQYPVLWGSAILKTKKDSTQQMCPTCGAVIRQVKAGRRGKDQIYKCQLCKRVYFGVLPQNSCDQHIQILTEYMLGEYLQELERKYGIGSFTIESWAKDRGVYMTSITRKLIRWYLGKSY